MSTSVELFQDSCPGSVAQLLQKEREDITRKDLLDLADRCSVEMVNFRFVAADGRLKSLNFAVSDRKRLDRILGAGERVDGSSLFPFVDPGSSDLYVVPRFRTAFFNPFAAHRTLDVLCSFFNFKGEPLSHGPDQLVRSADDALFERTGFRMESLAELEYYMIAPPTPLYPTEQQRGYGEAPPFSRTEPIRTAAMMLLTRMGYRVKYGHSEVGRVMDRSSEMEQCEIEFDLAPVEDSADAVVVARWVLRMLAARAGVTVTFAPKLVQGHAGSGLHVHSRLVRDGKDAIADESGINETGKRLLAGYLSLAPSLTAFGNTIPTSYLRLVPNQEAPVHVCWGERNRSVLIRVPLSWSGAGDMTAKANPKAVDAQVKAISNCTLELRSPDGSADIHQLHAGMCVAALHGLTVPGAVEYADSLRVESNIFKPEAEQRRSQLPKLPSSCQASAAALLEHRKHYEEHGVFSPQVIDKTASRLMAFGEEEARCRAAGFEEINDLIARYLHCQ
ncbi:MAG: glutamine synthetase [Deltaproteobacteria bacterium]|nr:glutamine synthetase [Deltaproteobacteria bacterium]